MERAGSKELNNKYTTYQRGDVPEGWQGWGSIENLLKKYGHQFYLTA